MLANITTDDNPQNFLPEIFDGDVPETFPGSEPEPEPEPPLPPDYPYSEALYNRQDPTIQSQYSASDRIIALVRSSRIRVLPDVDIQTFFQNIFDIETASGYGLDVWGRIVGIDRYLPMADTENWFGFFEADFEPFDQCPMWDGRRNEWSKPLGDDEYRTLILWKALANISTADAYSLNNLLQELFVGKEIFVQESYDIKTIGVDEYLNYPNAQIYQDTFGFGEADYEPFNQAPLWDGRYFVRISNVMELTLYVFFDLKPYERAILEEYGLLAKGAGVGFNWVEIPLPVFGFAEADYDPFDQAPFWNGGYIKWEDNDYPYFGFLESDCQPFSQYPFFEPDIPYYGFAEANCNNMMPFWDGKEKL